MWMQLFAKIVFIISTVLSAYAYTLFHKNQLYYLFGFIILALITAIIDFFLSNKKILIHNKKVFGILEGAYFVTGFKNSDVRLTLYCPCDLRKGMLKQFVPYVPNYEYSHFKKGLHESKGIVGLVFRTKKFWLEVIKDRDKIRDVLIEKWGFTDSEAKKLQLDKKSYLGIPILDRKENVVGIIYLDSGKDDVFTNRVIDTISRACIPLAELL